MRGRATFTGGMLWLVAAVLQIGALVLGAATSAVPYSSVVQLVNDLGRTQCGPVGYPFGTFDVCMPLHGVVNGLGVVVGALVILGALLLRPWLEGRGHEHLSMWLIVVSGAGRIGTSLVPIDVDAELHAWFRIATTLAGGLASFLLAVSLIRRHRAVATVGFVLAAVSIVAGVLTSIPATWEELPLGIASRAAGTTPLVWLAVVGARLMLGRGGRAVDDDEIVEPPLPVASPV